MATLKELSDRTGYSPATISRILTGDPALAVSEEARKRVLEEAGRLNYAATKSRRGRAPKNLLRLGLAEMLTPSEQLSDPYYLYLRGFVAQACQERKYALLPLPRVGEGFGPPEGGVVDGVAAIGVFTPAQAESLWSVSGNLVFVDSSPDESRCDSVVINYALGISLAVEHLVQLEHRRIGFIGPAVKLGDHKEPAPEVRRAHFVRLMEARGNFDPGFLLESPMDARATCAALGEYLASGRPRPTAFLAANEENAIGAVRAIMEAGLRIPEDISLVSFNDTPLSALMSPPLTSVSPHAEEMSRTAVRLLAERARGPGRVPVRVLPQKVVVPPSLVLRESVGKPPAE